MPYDSLRRLDRKLIQEMPAVSTPLTSRELTMYEVMRPLAIELVAAGVSPHEIELGSNNDLAIRIRDLLRRDEHTTEQMA